MKKSKKVIAILSVIAVLIYVASAAYLLIANSTTLYVVKEGELTEEEAKNHPKKNVLMKALGANNPIDIDIFDCDMDIDSILLCSDGLTTMLDNEQIEKVLLSDIGIEDKVIKLIRKSNNRGGSDNISVAYLELKESGE